MTFVRFCKKLWFSVRLQFYKINCGFGFFGSVFFCTACCLMCLHTECFPVYCFITVLFFFSFTNNADIANNDHPLFKRLWCPIRTLKQMHESHVFELWMRRCEKPSPNHRSWFLKTKLEKLSLRFLNFEVSSNLSITSVGSFMTDHNTVCLWLILRKSNLQTNIQSSDSQTKIR